MSKVLLSFCILLISMVTEGQQIFDKSSEIEVEFSSANVPYYTHVFEKGQSLYALSRIFGTSVAAIESLNTVIAENITEGTKLVFPIKQGQFIKALPASPQQGGAIPLIYKVKKGETLFRISKIYCGEDVEAMKKRNYLTSNDLSPDQKLIIGYLVLKHDDKSNNTAEKIEKKEDPYLVGPRLPVMADQELKDEFEPMLKLQEDVSDDAETESLKWVNTKGVAVWDKHSNRKGKKFVLHPYARINSEIELFNPIVNRTVKARVIGRIPAGAYTDDVDIILSPATATSLGALDSRLMIAMKYVE